MKMSNMEGRDIGPDEIRTSSSDLEMDLIPDSENIHPQEDASRQFRSIYRNSHENNISSMPPEYTPHHVYGTNQTVWMQHFEEPLDMTPADMSPFPSSDTVIEQTNIYNQDAAMLNEENRLQTFNSGWPSNSPVTPIDLARNGFYYIGPEDRVKCVFCAGILKKWEPGDSVEREHRSHFPRCPTFTPNNESLYVSGTSFRNTLKNQPDAHGAVSLALGSKGGDMSMMTGNALGIVSNMPKHPRFALESKRLETFINWPSQMRQKPEDLAKAGLFYLGKGDRVKCFSCDGILHSWDPTDDPMSEHARWFPECAFIKLVKDDSKTSMKSSPRQSEFGGMEQSASVQALVDYGYSLQSISAAIEKLHINGADNSAVPSASEILNTILETDCEPETKTNTPPLQSSLTNGHANQNPDDMQSLLDENRELKEQRLCKVCLENEISVIFLPCGHLACCRQCTSSLSECPICRSAIKGAVKAFWA